jgi:hypothetical protein
MIQETQLRRSRVIQALEAQAVADREKALMALDLLENQAVGIGDHTANDLLNDATESLRLLADADERLETIKRYFITSTSSTSA